MSRIHLMIAVLMGVLLSIVIFITSQAQEAIVTTTPTLPSLIVTPVPAPKETIVIPQGYTNCFTVAAGWYNNIWVPEHRVCQYAATTDATYEGTTWIEGYWACNVYKNQECTNWEWKPGRWVKTLEVY